jgi:hypothetical protein
MERLNPFALQHHQVSLMPAEHSKITKEFSFGKAESMALRSLQQ